MIAHEPRQTQVGRPRLGAHMSITGGLPRAIDRGVATGCESLQIFTRSSGQWRARPIPDAELQSFRTRVAETGIGPIVAHASYLINLASPDESLRTRSIRALEDELSRADRLGLAGVVLHPGAYTTSTEQDGIRRILLNDGGEAWPLLEVIQRKNREQGREPATRADLRYGSGPDGQVFIMNKQDGVIRRLVP